MSIVFLRMNCDLVSSIVDFVNSELKTGKFDAQRDLNRLRELVYEKFGNELDELTFGDAWEIDAGVFGQDNHYWTRAFGNPVDGDTIEDGRKVLHAGIFTMSLESDDEWSEYSDDDQEPQALEVVVSSDDESEGDDDQKAQALEVVVSSDDESEGDDDQKAQALEVVVSSDDED